MPAAAGVLRTFNVPSKTQKCWSDRSRDYRKPSYRDTSPEGVSCFRLEPDPATGSELCRCARGNRGDVRFRAGFCVG